MAEEKFTSNHSGLPTSDNKKGRLRTTLIVVSGVLLLGSAFAAFYVTSTNKDKAHSEELEKQQIITNNLKESHDSLTSAHDELKVAQFETNSKYEGLSRKVNELEANGNETREMFFQKQIDDLKRDADTERREKEDAIAREKNAQSKSDEVLAKKERDAQTINRLKKDSIEKATQIANFQNLQSPPVNSIKFVNAPDIEYLGQSDSDYKGNLKSAFKVRITVDLNIALQNDQFLTLDVTTLYTDDYKNMPFKKTHYGHVCKFPSPGNSNDSSFRPWLRNNDVDQLKCYVYLNTHGKKPEQIGIFYIPA